ncbi:MAG: nitrous oxide reductase accessory protein NosL [Candidatus Eisenbacteria bacterium]|nr:nitrous oxide reductase accessory protein NosL [Candidatus Eisenbacteria bacterium]
MTDRVRDSRRGARPGRTGIPRIRVARCAALLLACGIAFPLAGCGSRPAGPRPIARGTPCAACGMEIQDLRLACERIQDGEVRCYDAIECLVREERQLAAAPGSGRAPGAIRHYLPDYDQSALHAADSMWVVQGHFPTPMGGGLAAFLDRRAAEDLAAQTGGRVQAWPQFLAAAPGGAP